ncbi:MFS transporter [Cohnella nanjingensis]|uniref:MFS transporter n=1 Tax=Cohnella nanjingensis TaxID=1387779 RepID=A0A7X0RP06_9BACL|nr:MFS transporter [Cohnella nanjingensis]MBB6669750.1 MFS transporter [Cohnella nanjingensis]
MNRPTLWTKDFLAVCLSNFFIFLNFYLLAATLPLYVTERLHGSQQMIGLVITVYVIAAVVLRPLAGQWVDRFGKKVVLFSLALFLTCTVLYFGAGTIAILLVLRVVHGASYGVASTSTGAIASDLVPASRKGEGIGYFGMFMSLAMVIGPFLGLTLTTHFGYNVLFAVCSVTTAFALLFGLAFRAAKKTGTDGAAKKLSLHWRDLIEVKALPVSIAGFILAFSYSSITSFISVYAAEIDLSRAASYFFVCFAVMIVLPRPWIGKIFDKYGEHVLAYPGILLFIFGMIILSQAHSEPVFLLSGAVIGLGHGALIPCFQTLAIRSAPARSGLATGTFFLLFDLGYGIGSYVLGVVAEHTHYHKMYLIAALLVILTAVLYYALHHRVRGRRFEEGSISA